MNYGKQMANHLDLIQNNTGLNIYQKSDSILKLVKIISKTDPIITARAKNEGPIYIRFNKEFPEFGKMSKEERSNIFKKAGAIFYRH